MKNKIVIFTSHNARILNIDDEMIHQYEQYANAVINPDLSQVKGIPPHFWKLQGKRVVPMTFEEKKFRTELINKHQVKKSIEIPKDGPVMPSLFYVVWLKFIMFIQSLSKKRGLS